MPLICFPMQFEYVRHGCELKTAVGLLVCSRCMCCFRTSRRFKSWPIGSFFASVLYHVHCRWRFESRSPTPSIVVSKPPNARTNVIDRSSVMLLGAPATSGGSSGGAEGGGSCLLDHAVLRARCSLQVHASPALVACPACVVPDDVVQYTYRAPCLMAAFRLP